MPGDKMARLVGLALRVGVYVFLVMLGPVRVRMGAERARQFPGGSGARRISRGGDRQRSGDAFFRTSQPDRHRTGLERASVRNLLIGLAGGAGSACLVLAGPVWLGWRDSSRFRARSHMRAPSSS